MHNVLVPCQRASDSHGDGGHIHKWVTKATWSQRDHENRFDTRVVKVFSFPLLSSLLGQQAVRQVRGARPHLVPAGSARRSLLWRRCDSSSPAVVASTSCPFLVEGLGFPSSVPGPPSARPEGRSSRSQSKWRPHLHVKMLQKRYRTVMFCEAFLREYEEVCRQTVRDGTKYEKSDVPPMPRKHWDKALPSAQCLGRPQQQYHVSDRI